MNSSIVGYRVGNAYKTGAKIGSGSFGEIHNGKERKTTCCTVEP
jgi:casein kinase I family protein HRR25